MEFVEYNMPGLTPEQTEWLTIESRKRDEADELYEPTLAE